MALQLETLLPGSPPQRVSVPTGRLKVPARPGAQYRLVDDTGQVPQGASVKRVGNDLLIDGLPADQAVEIEGFFTTCTPSNSCSVSTETIGGAAGGAVTPDSEPLAALADGSFLLFAPGTVAAPLAPPAADSGFGGYKAVAAVLGGLAIAGLAAGGGGGGSDSTVDTTPPPPPTFGTTSASADTTPVLSGLAEAGSRVTVRIDIDGDGAFAGAGDVTFTTTALADGTWRIDTGTAAPSFGGMPAGGLPPGKTYNLTAFSNDASGNISPATAGQITIDVTAPAAPTLALTTASDTGPSSTDRVTSDTTPTIRVTFQGSGTVAAGDTVSLQSGGSLVATAVVTAADVANGFVDVTTSALGADGIKSITATIADAAGNVSPASTPLLISLDTLAPTAPNITSPTGTNDRTPTITGFAQPGSNVTLGLDIDRNGVPDVTYNTAASNVGSWTVDTGTATPSSGAFPPGGLPDNNTVLLSASASDTAGNAGPMTTGSLLIDTTIPAPPTISTVATDDVVNIAEATAGVVVAGTLPLAGRPVTVEWVDGTGAIIGSKLAAVTGNNWTATFAAGEVPADGNSTVRASYTNAVGTPSQQATATVLIDRVAPAAPAITDDTSGGTATGPVTFTFTFTEPMVGFDASDVTVAGGTAGAFTATSPSVYSLVVNPTPDVAGTIAVTVPAGQTDAAGNPTAAPAQGTQPVDIRVPPTLAPITDNASGTATGPVTFTFNWSEAVTGFNASDIVVTGAGAGTIGSLVGSGSTYTLTYTPAANSSGTLGLSVGPGVVTDAAGNASTGTVATSQPYNSDSTAPTLLVSDSFTNPGATNSPVTFTFQWSEPVTGFDITDVTVTGAGSGTVGSLVALDSDTYTLTYAPAAASSGTVGVTVGAGAVVDANSNANTSGGSGSQAYDTQAPTLLLTDNVPGGTTNSPVTFTFTFSEPVTGFDSGDLNVVGGTPGVLSGSGSTYSLAVAPLINTQDGLITVTVAGAGVPYATDAAGNSISGPQSATQAYDTQAPTVAINDGTAAPVTNAPVTFTILFSEPVLNFVAGDIVVTGGTAGAFSGSGSSYTIEVTPDANTTGTLTASVAAGVANDAAGNANAVAVPQGSQAFDTQAPTQTASFAFADDVAPDVGSIASGGNSDDLAPAITLTLSSLLLPGESVTLTRTGTSGDVRTLNTGDTLNYGDTLAAGGYTYSATITDSLGNVANLDLNGAAPGLNYTITIV